MNEAASILEKAFKMCKQNPDPAVRPELGLALADIHFELGNRETAEELYRKYIHKVAGRHEVLRPRLKKYAFLLSEAGKIELARQTLQLLNVG